MKTKLLTISLTLLFCFTVFVACEPPVEIPPCNHTGGNPTCLVTAACSTCGENYFGDHSFDKGVCSVCDMVGVTPDQSFTYLVEDNKVTITEFIGDEERILIPDTINGNPVTAIGDNAFNENKNIKSVSIGKNTQIIGKKAFYACDSLASIVLAGGKLTEIGDHAFALCAGLDTAILPYTLKTIGIQAFRGTMLLSVTIPAAVTEIGNAAFATSYLTSIQVESQNLVYRSQNNAIIKIEGNVLVQGCVATVIPDSVEGIGDYAFAMLYDLESMTIPESIKSIGNNAFFGCTSLKSIDIPNGVTSLGNSAFAGCFALTSLKIPDSVQNLGIRIITDSAVTNVVIGDGVKVIKTDTFQYCLKLTSLVIGSGVTSIEFNAFNNIDLMLLNIFYNGDMIMWNEVEKSFIGARVYYYSEGEPSGSGDYWHYDENQNIVIWFDEE